VRTHVSEDLPLVVNSDANWLFMILVNFGSNSMKHTRRGTVTISATRVGRLHLRFDVSDTGCGVPAEFVPLLFQPFSSASTTASSVESTGLGLYHSKQLAGILGGKVGYRPNASGGSTFYVEVPIALVATAEAKSVLVKNRLECARLGVAEAAPEHGTRRGEHRKGASRTRRESVVTDAVVLVPAAATPATATATTVHECSVAADAAASAGHEDFGCADGAFETASCAVSSLNAPRVTAQARSSDALSPSSPSAPPQPNLQPQPQSSLLPESVPS